MTFQYCILSRGVSGKRSRLKLPKVILLALLMAAPCLAAQQPPVAKGTRLSKIEFSGLQRRTAAEAIAASGLRAGQEIDIPALDEAAQRLMDSGLFKKLSYRLRTSGDQATVIFTVEEEAKGAAAPVAFDNFVWFSDDELSSAIRRQVPSYDGTAPDSAVDSIKKALQQLLQERKIPGSVEYMPSADLRGGNAEHVFSVEGVKVPLCSLHFTGASAIQETELVKNSKPLMGDDYRRNFVLAFAQTNLIPLYRERGHLRASFRAPQARLETGAGGGCKDGVTVTLPVEEGAAYSWDRAEWAGNSALSTQELEAFLGMKAGELANGLKIDKGIAALMRAYGNKGYLLAGVRPVPSFEDASRRVTYRMEVKEGPQFRMGTLDIKGLPESTANRLKERWKLRPGDVYDASYIERFLKNEITVDAFGGGPRPKGVAADPKLDRQKLTVDVTLTFKL